MKKEEIAEVSKKVSTHWKNNAFQWNVVEPSEGNKISQYAPLTSGGSLSNGGMQEVMWTDFDYAWMNSAPEWDRKDNFYAAYSTGVGVGATNKAYKYYFVPEKNDFVYKTVADVAFTDDEIDEFAAITAQDIMDNHVNVAGNDYEYKYGKKVFNCNKIYKKVNGVEYLICEMNQTTGEVVWNTYGTGKEVAREVLNANPYTEFTVGMITRHALNCNVALPLLIDGSLAKFKVHALRPITMASSKKAAVTDADRSTYSFSIYDCLTFTDWRNIKFSANPWLFKFYEIKSVDIDYSAITAVIDGVEKELSIAKPEVTISKTGGSSVNLPNATTAAAAKSAMGQITYDRNSGSPVVTAYQIKVPVYVTYALSATNDKTLKTVITIDVKPSIQ